MTARLDLGRLVPLPGTFVDEALRQRHTDILFTAPLGGQDAYLYILMEHQSKIDRRMPYRMLRYITRIWDRFLDDNPETLELPPVIPLVVYNGRNQWSAPQRLEDLIGPGLDADAEYLPRFSFLLEDLSAVDSDRLMERIVTPMPRVTLVLLTEAPGSARVHEVLWRLIDPTASTAAWPTPLVRRQRKRL